MPAECISTSPLRLPPNTFVVGANSRIFKFSFPNTEYISVSGRVENVCNIPLFPDGSTILVFSDAPSKDDNLAVLASIAHRLTEVSRFKLIFISSISALFYDPRRDKFAGTYAEKKNIAEDFLVKSINRDNISIIRLGNFFCTGNWKNISQKTKVILLPRGFNICAASGVCDIQDAVKAILASNSGGIFNAWKPAYISQHFSKVIIFPGLQKLYKNQIASQAIRVVSKALWKFGIFVPSPADINSFNPYFAERALAS